MQRTLQRTSLCWCWAQASIRSEKLMISTTFIPGRGDLEQGTRRVEWMSRGWRACRRSCAGDWGKAGVENTRSRSCRCECAVYEEVYEKSAWKDSKEQADDDVRKTNGSVCWIGGKGSTLYIPCAGRQRRSDKKRVVSEWQQQSAIQFLWRRSDVWCNVPDEPLRHIFRLFVGVNNNFQSIILPGVLVCH